MGALAQTLGGLGRPLVLCVLVLLGLGLLDHDPGTGGEAAGGFSCKHWTSDPKLNRFLCQYHPARIWNMPVTDLLPSLSGRTAEEQE